MYTSFLEGQSIIIFRRPYHVSSLSSKAHVYRETTKISLPKKILKTSSSSKFSERDLETGGFTLLGKNQFDRISTPHNVVPRLHHGLEEVLFSRGVHIEEHIPALFKNISTWDKVNISKFDQFMPPSKDKVLRDMGLKRGCKVLGSTSSVTELMSHLYYAFSRFKHNNTTCLRFTRKEREEVRVPDFAPQALKPYAFQLKNHDGIYSIDKINSPFPVNNKHLIDLGKFMEMAVTNPEDRVTSMINNVLDPNWNPAKECYNYLQVGSTLLRSQIDCYHPKLPNLFFDMKCRATHPIRYNIEISEKYSGRPVKLTGRHYSFEKEFYDLIRSNFLKFSFQGRIGNMDGMLFAYHNFQSVVGFEYITLKEIEECIFETTAMAAASFEVATGLVDTVIAFLKDTFKSQDLVVLLKSEEFGKSVCRTNIYVKTPDESVHKFELQLEIFVNGEATKGSFLIQNEDDDVKVYYKIIPVHLPEVVISSQMSMEFQSIFHNKKPVRQTFNKT